MKLAIMQPYLFPYVGYYSLVSNVDKFVFYDDVSFIKGGWINRNRLIISGKVGYFTVPLCGASSSQKISEIKIQPKKRWLRKMLASIAQSYGKAPYFLQTYDLIREVIDLNDERISALASRSVRLTAERFGLSTQFVASSKVYGNSDLKGVQRIIDICRRESAEEYYNLPGGKFLYDEKEFQRYGIGLKFVPVFFKEYKQLDRPFQGGLSIIDIMMFNSFDECRLILQGQGC